MRDTGGKVESDWTPLVLAAQKGDKDARDRVITGNMGVVRHIAFSYARNTSGVDVEDLVQEGVFALMEAIRYWRPDGGAKYNSYAGDCVRRRLFNVIKRHQERHLSTTQPDSEALESIACADSVERDLEEQDASVTIHDEDPVLRLRHGIGTDGASEMSFASIARMLGISKDAAQDRYVKARSRLLRASPSLN